MRWEMTREEEIIRGAMFIAGIRRRVDLSHMTGINDQTMRSRFREPDKITLGELRRIATATGMSDEKVLEVYRG